MSEIQQNSLLSISSEKMAKFISGGYQTNRHEKERNEKLSKQRKEEEETAAAYSEYVKTFEQNPMSASSASIFVRGGMINSKGIQESASSSTPDLYVLGKVEEPEEAKSDQKQVNQGPRKINFTRFVPVTTSTTNASTKKSSGTDLASMFGSHSDEEDEKKKDNNIKVNRKTNIHYAIHKNAEKSQLDLMFEEMEANSKTSRNLPSKETEPADRIGSSYEDPTNTNVYIGNLPRSITVDSLFSLCAYYGFVRHVAIKYTNASNPYGFVCMRSHHEAEILIECLQNHMMDGSRLRITWGKSGITHGVVPHVPPAKTPIPILIPDLSLKNLIQNVAVMVHNRGAAFEALLKQRVSKEDPNWLFLFVDGCPANVFYRWCLLVLGNNETFSRYSLLPFCFFVNDDWFLPPPVYDEASEKKKLDMKMASLNRLKRPQDEDVSENKRPKIEQGSNILLDSISLRLEPSQFDWLCVALRTISLKRVSILRIMTFCMDNSIFADHIVCVLRDSICDNVPYLGVYQKEYDCSPAVRIARLYVVNDLLYNADNGATTSYRMLLQNELPIMIEALSRAENACKSQMEKKEIKLRVEKMLNGWLQNSLLSVNFIRGLQATFLMSDEELDGVLEDPSVGDNDDALRLRCKYNGLCNYGSRGQLLMRLSLLNKMLGKTEEEEEEEPALDPELDGEALSVSDYDECFIPMEVAG